MRKLWLVLAIILPFACGPTIPSQPKDTLRPPPSYSRPSQPSASPIPSYQPWSRQITAEVKSPKGATSSGTLQIFEQLKPGQTSSWEYTYTLSGEIVVLANSTRIEIRFTQLGERSADILGGASLIFYQPVGLALDIAAPNDKALDIDWNRVSLVGPSGDSHRVIHKGQRLSERDRPTPPSLIPPGSKLSDFVFPADFISYELRDWNLGHFFERISPGSSFALFMPIKAGDAEIQHHVVFTVNNTQ